MLRRASCGKEARRRSEEHTSELQSLRHLVCRLLLEKKKKKIEDEVDVEIAVQTADRPQEGVKLSPPPAEFLDIACEPRIADAVADCVCTQVCPHVR